MHRIYFTIGVLLTFPASSLPLYKNPYSSHLLFNHTKWLDFSGGAVLEPTNLLTIGFLIPGSRPLGLDFLTLAFICPVPNTFKDHWSSGQETWISMQILYDFMTKTLLFKANSP